MGSDDSSLIERILSNSDPALQNISLETAPAFLLSREVPHIARLLVADWVSNQNEPAAVSLLLKVVNDTAQPETLREHCQNLLPGMSLRLSTEWVQQVAQQENPSSIGLLLNVFSNSQMPESLRSACREALLGMKNSYAVICAVDGCYQNFQKQMSAINAGKQTGPLCEINYKLCLMQTLMRNLNNPNLDVRSLSVQIPAKDAAAKKLVPALK